MGIVRARDDLLTPLSVEILIQALGIILSVVFCCFVVDQLHWRLDKGLNVCTQDLRLS
jgi:hypothetical protein